MMSNSSPVQLAIGRLLIDGYRSILAAYELMGYKVSEDDNFTDTAERAAKAAQELVRPVSEVHAELDDLVGKTFPARYDQMVISKHNICFGLCPHHLLPVVYRVSLAYLPQERVIGISKLSRLIRLMARRPVLQEELTHELAHLLYKRLDSRGAAVYCEGLHMCMAARGVEAHEARLVTSAVFGVFVDKPEMHKMFMDQVSMAGIPLL